MNQQQLVNDANLQLAAQRKLGARREELGLPKDLASDNIWFERFKAGTHTEEDAYAALAKKQNSWSQGQNYTQGNTSAPPPDSFGQPSAGNTMDSAEVVGEVAPGTDNWGYDAEFNEGMNRVEEQRANLRSQEEMQRRRMAEDAQRQQEENRRTREDNLEMNTENMADQGMVHSGINIKAQADIGEEYMRFNDQIEQAKARGDEDLAHWLTGQRQQLQNQEQTLTRERAAREAAEQELADMQEAIASTPTPTVAGRYPIEANITSAARQNITGADAQFMESPEDIARRVEAIFDNRNVSLVGHRSETDAQRLARIVKEIAEGTVQEDGSVKYRDFDDVRKSVDRLARIQNI